MLFAFCGNIFSFNVNPSAVLLLALPLVIAVDALIVWAVWRKASSPAAVSK